MIKLNLPQRAAKKAFLTGVLGSAALTAFYYLTLLLVTKDPLHPLVQFKLYQPWMTLLILGFGLQLGIFSLLRRGVRLGLSSDQQSEAQVMASSSAAVSGLSMAACCAHHLAEFVPILGLSGAALFLTEYQEQLLILGVLANFLGLIFMTWVLFGRRNFKTILNYL